MAAARKPLWRRVLRLGLLLALLFVVLSTTLVIALRWLPPPTTAFVMARRIDGWTGAAANIPIRRDWVAQSKIAPEMFLAVVAAEDQRFPDHYGFDLQAIEQALDDRERGKVRGASTISQQVAKPHYWYTFDIAPKSFLKEKWFHVQDSLQFVITEAMKGSQIRVFPFNPYKKSTLAIDNLEVKLIKVN